MCYSAGFRRHHAAVTPRFSLAGGGMLAITIALFGTMLYGYFYIYPDPTPRLTAAMATVLASPILAWSAWLPWLRRRSPWLRGALGAASAALGVAAAVALVEMK